MSRSLADVKLLLTGLVVLLAALALACGESATSTPTPGASPTATATPVATPTATPTPTPTPSAMPEPTGVLDIAVADLGPPIFTLADQDFLQSQFSALTTHEHLLGTDGRGNVVPRLLKSWEVSTDGLVYTMHLQEGVPWHDTYGDYGTFGADDVIFSVDEIAKEGSVHEQVSNVRRIFACEGCELVKLDDLNLELRRPTPTFEFTWHSRAPIPGFSMHSKKHFEDVGPETALQQDVGTGPWRTVEARSGEFRRMKAVRDHWRHTSQWDEAMWHDIEEESTRVANFLSGTLDTGAFTSDSVQAIRDANQPGVDFMKVPFAIQITMFLHGQQYFPDAPAHQAGADGSEPAIPMGDGADYRETCKTLAWVSCNRDPDSAEWEKARKVREAMNLAIDRQKLVNNIAGGEATPWYVAYWANLARMEQFGLDQMKSEFDPVRARELLEEAGYSDGFAITVNLIPQRAAAAQEASKAVATMWDNIGINTTQLQIAKSAFRPLRVSRIAEGTHADGDTPGWPEPIRIYSGFWNSISSFNFGFEHPWFEEKLAEVESTFDDEARWALQAEMARWMFDNGMVYPLYMEDTVWPLGPELGPWELMAGPSDLMNNWEFAPRRS